jgi:iron complex outermembrane receptor protein
MTGRWATAAQALCVALPSAGCLAQAMPAPQTVTVTATRIATPAFDVPASIDLVAIAPDADGKPGINLSESLGGVPGLQARDRQNYAQDVQISVRGFGARATFGIRGVRLYVDGIPATLPDGQGQISNVDLGSAAAVEVLRGPFSALYGNSSGGVLQVFTEDGAGRPRLTVGAGGGSDGLRHADTQLTGADGGFRYVLSGAHFQTDGYRDHSAARRDTANAKLGIRLDDASELTVIGNAVDLPMALDPLGLTRAGLAADPRAVDPSALAFDTRKSMNQTQGGLIYVRRFGPDGELRAMVYDGARRTTQFQSIPVGAQGNPSSPGGVIGLGRDYVGTDLRWTTRGTLGAQRWSLVGGLASDRLIEHRRGYENFTGTGVDQVLGVQGALRRDEVNTVTDLDPYLQGEWHPTEAWTVDAGLRRSHVRFGSRDAFVTATNPDDSGGAVYTATLPVLGVLYALQPGLHLYATAGQGFETPTLNELAYRPNGLTGLNFGLVPARSDNFEAGVKTRSPAWGEASLAAFFTRTSDEIVTLTNTGGRSTYQNAGATRRRGMELAWSKTLAGDLAAHVAWTIVDARYRDAFLTCTASPCPAPTVPVAAGNRIPGIARETAFASLAWQPAAGWRGSIEARAASHVEVNDANTDAAASFAIASVGAGYVMPLGAWKLSGFARVDNLFDRRYVGSVIVNEGNARFFEPASGRTVFAGVSGSYRF